jgi:hypothetical protein
MRLLRIWTRRRRPRRCMRRRCVDKAGKALQRLKVKLPGISVCAAGTGRKAAAGCVSGTAEWWETSKAVGVRPDSGFKSLEFHASPANLDHSPGEKRLGHFGHFPVPRPTRTPASTERQTHRSPKTQIPIRNLSTHPTVGPRNLHPTSLLAIAPSR